ncbi:hypothetical protein [Mesorhizobium sp. M1399]|uniref:hypothetical protein n=1 Tax=Mesorhizobium sp. M1399 TaxID=2957096 RepID=UPI003339AA28
MSLTDRFDSTGYRDGTERWTGEGFLKRSPLMVVHPTANLFRALPKDWVEAFKRTPMMRCQGLQVLCFENLEEKLSLTDPLGEGGRGRAGIDAQEVEVHCTSQAIGLLSSQIADRASKRRISAGCSIGRGPASL